jgi:ABC-type nitrate/sulfonate/bicarbonate transport system substrate-binding protein
MYRLAVADLGSPSYFVATAAAHLGFFQREGVDVQGIEGGVEAESNTSGLNDGSAHFFAGPAYGPLKTFPNFSGVKMLCALSQYSYWFMGIRADIDIRRGDIQALRGLRISSSRSSPGLGLRRMLIESGLDPAKGDVRIVDSPLTGKGEKFRGSDGIVALRSGVSDAFWGNGMRLEMAVRAGVAKLHIDLRRGDGPPAARYYNFPVLAATEAFVTENPSVAAGAVRAIVKVQKALAENPGLATEVGAALFPVEEAVIIRDLVARDAPFYRAEITRDAVIGLNAFCVESGLIDSPVAYEKLVATQLSELRRG